MCKWFDRWELKHPVALYIGLVVFVWIIALIVSFFITWAFLGPPPCCGFDN